MLRDRDDCAFLVEISIATQKSLHSSMNISHFDLLIFDCDTEVDRGKPFSDVYLYASQKMSAEPSRCLVIKDTPIGVQGGVSALPHRRRIHPRRC
jgi:HAD superfamily hydrolase (TIGR01509 family)